MNLCRSALTVSLILLCSHAGAMVRRCACQRCISAMAQVTVAIGSTNLLLYVTTAIGQVWPHVRMAVHVYLLRQFVMDPLNVLMAQTSPRF